MLLSLVLRLSPREPVTLPAHTGRAAHAALLGLVAQSNPALADQLHTGDGPRPFTCSSLIGAHRTSPETVTVAPDDTCWLRFTSLIPELSQILQDHFLNRPPSTIELDRQRFRVLSATADASVHPWAHRTDFATLAQHHLMNADPPPHRISLHFASPTTFRSGNLNVPLPLPSLVFGSLLERWNAFAPMALNPELKRFAEECVAIARYTLRTRMLPIKKGLRVGYVGECHYVVMNRDRYWLRQLQLLADSALFAGVGAQTTMGMGQCRRLPGPSS